MNSITLQLEDFEGPLDLLLYLIKKNDLEVSRISLSAITEQYLKYLDSLKELDIDVASDFLYMAAELAQIKSRLLLPNEKLEEEEVDEVADDLIARLKQYEQYKLAAQGLDERAWLHRDVFNRDSFFQEDNQKVKKQKPDDYEVDTFELVRAFHELLNKSPKETVNHHVLNERASVTERIYEVLNKLKEHESLKFEELFQTELGKPELVITFLAILEIAKLKLIRIYQTETTGQIRVSRRENVDQQMTLLGEQLEDVESYK